MDLNQQIPRDLGAGLKTNDIYLYLHKQIPVMMVLSLFPGLGYIFLGWLNDHYVAAIVWYILIILASTWSYQLYKALDLQSMSESQLDAWYENTKIAFYLFFLLWGAIFLIYARETETGMHYIAIFTEIGASTVAAAILYPDRKLYKPIILVLIIPLVVYFFMIGTWYGYILTIFASIFGWVLLYAANGSNQLFTKTIYQSTHDFLTGIFNRQYFINFFQTRLNTLREQGEFSYLLLLDLDHFKTVNDSLGHDIGDSLLQEVANRIKTSIPTGTLLARLGGDEFIITGNNYPTKEAARKDALELSQELLSVLKSTYIIKQHHIYISASIGVSLIEPGEVNAVNIIKSADIAMYEVKAKGRDGVFLSDESISQRIDQNLKLEQLLHFAEQRKQIHLVYQPQVDRDDQLSGVEVLARWRCDELGDVPPKKFIPIAEQTGLIIELGRHILESALQTLADWNRDGIQVPQMSINISMRQFMHYNFVDDVRELSERYLTNENRTRIVFEITESVVAEDIQRVVEIINQVRDLGISFSMDDFGTGYSSLSYIRQLPINEIKIDRHFIRDLSKDPGAEEMVNTILHMAKIFDLTVVAEGVESEQQKAFLLEHDCKVFQGYLFSRPVLKDEFVNYYHDHKPAPGSG
jgi:diguanylate cyclase (GGDEF)-like protein